MRERANVMSEMMVVAEVTMAMAVGDDGKKQPNATQNAQFQNGSWDSPFPDNAWLPPSTYKYAYVYHIPYVVHIVYDSSMLYVEFYAPPLVHGERTLM